eukprot:CAMPEP_0197850062 /NCGR_PEP_ID=MMETSP1438-20131217/14113_1 /TAXON_ID=1461541 /ORGANISM="Pterosperma sp., Strain CCMP1384" /LENGTH=192 /DNA_ID=CAMNT_0043463013 /DNA_START=211 /DNA_END=786 /DNA_ORIENTATION=+
MSGTYTSPAASLTDSELEARRKAVDDMFQGYKKKAFSKAPDMSVKELHKMLDKKNSSTSKQVVVIDVRTPGEREVSIIPQAISRSEFEAHKKDFEKHTVVAYCTIGYRSGQYVQELLGEGFNAFNLKGSILEWSLEGFALVDPNGKTTGESAETKRVHVFGENWNLVGRDYEAVWFVRLPIHRLLWDFICGW